jgi:small subunit ribosomal protein S3
MAKKVNPKIFRIGITEKSVSNWYAPNKQMASLIHQDRKIRLTITKIAKPAGIDKITISRTSNNIYIDLFVGRPGIAIGKGGSGIEALEKAIEKDAKVKAKISVHEVKQPYLSSALVAGAVSEAMLRRIPPKVAMKQQIEKIEASGAKGARIEVAGIGPVKQSRTERVEMRGGKIPLTTLRAKIDYAAMPVLTDKVYGIKVWIYKGEN